MTNTTLVTGGNIRGITRRPASIPHTQPAPGKYGKTFITIAAGLNILAAIIGYQLLSSLTKVTTTSTSYQIVNTNSSNLPWGIPLFIIPALLLIIAIANQTGDLPTFDRTESLKALGFSLGIAFMVCMFSTIPLNFTTYHLTTWAQNHHIAAPQNLQTPDTSGTFYALNTSGDKVTLNYQKLTNGYKVTILNTDKN